MKYCVVKLLYDPAIFLVKPIFDLYFGVLETYIGPIFLLVQNPIKPIFSEMGRTDPCIIYIYMYMYLHRNVPNEQHIRTHLVFQVR